MRPSSLSIKCPSPSPWSPQLLEKKKNGPRRKNLLGLSGEYARALHLTCRSKLELQILAANSNSLFCTISAGIRALLCSVLLLASLFWLRIHFSEDRTCTILTTTTTTVRILSRNNMLPAFCLLPSLPCPDPWLTGKKTNVNLFAYASCTASVL